MRYIVLLVSVLLVGCTGRTGGSARTGDDGARASSGVATRDTTRAAAKPRVAGRDTTRAAVKPGVAADSTAPTPLTIHLLRVTAPAGGGDAILVADSTATPARHILIDAGNDGVAAAELSTLGVDELDLMILTHAHHDHYGGMPAILKAVPVRLFAFNGQVRTAVTYRRLLEEIEERVPQVAIVDIIRRIRLGEEEGATVITLLPPRSLDLDTDTNDGRRLNNGSLAVRIDKGSFSFLTTGDAQLEANRYFAAEFPALVDVTVLKAGHHGANNATQPFWLDATSPEVVVISANGTTHPHAEVVEMIEGREITVYCTPQHGRITLQVDLVGSYAIKTNDPAERRCEPGDKR